MGRCSSCSDCGSMANLNKRSASAAEVHIVFLQLFPNLYGHLGPKYSQAVALFWASLQEGRCLKLMRLLRAQSMQAQVELSESRPMFVGVGEKKPSGRSSGAPGLLTRFTSRAWEGDADIGRRASNSAEVAVFAHTSSVLLATLRPSKITTRIETLNSCRLASGFHSSRSPSLA